MKRPLIWAIPFTIAGIVAGRFIDDTIGVLVALLLGLAVTICLYLNFKNYRVFFLLIFMAIGAMRISWASTNNNVLELAANNKEEVVLQGRVINLTKSSNNNQKVILKTDKIKTQEEEIQVSINISAILKKGEKVEIGQNLLLQGILLPLSPQRNPGGYDEFTYAKSREIDYKMLPVIISKGEQTQDLNTLLFSLREQVSKVFDKALPQRESGIVKSMILGDKTDLDDYISETYKVAGIYHILVISGLHITLIGFGIQWFFALFLNKRFAGLPALFLLCLYCIFTGASVSAIRAVTMFGVWVIAKVINRDYDLLSSTAFACIALLIYQPFYLWDIGFQLSFSGVLGIGFAYAPMLNMLNYLKERFKFCKVMLKYDYFVKAIAVILAVQLTNAPVIAYHFSYYATYSIFVNLLIIPTVSIIVLLGMIIAVVGFISLELATIASGAVFALLKLYEWICRFFVELPFAKLLTGQPTWYLIVLWYAAVLLIVLIFIKEQSKINLKPVKYLGLVIAAIIAASLIKIYIQPPTVTMLDVGQGDSFIIECQNKVYLVDCGNEGYGTYSILPYLDYKGIDYLDGIFISHFDKDHSAGLFEVIPEKKIGGLFIKEDTWESEKYKQEVLTLVNEYKIPVRYLQKDDVLTYGDLKFACISAKEPQANSNDNSMIIKFSYGEADFLFTGDISQAAERKILTSYEDENLNSEVLKISHHGSKYSSSGVFMSAVSPKIALISAGANNTYGHPTKEVLDRLQEFGVICYNTIKNGAVTITISNDGKNLRATPYLN